MINAISQHLIYDFIAQQDADPKVPRVLSEEDVIELALRLLTNVNNAHPDAPLPKVLLFTLMQFEEARK